MCSGGLIMRWRDGRRSDNVEDQRGRGVSRGAIGGGIGLIIIVAIGLLSGADPLTILGAVIGQSGGSLDGLTPSAPLSAADNESADFVSVVLADTEDTWLVIFQQQGRVYQQPKLVLFSGGVDSACGFAQSAMGPFYCPNDQKVYIDLDFYRELKDQLGAPGDFAQAYVIAHEVGHHVQNLLGTSDRSRVSRAGVMRSLPTNILSCWNCRPIVMRAYGRIMLTHHVTLLKAGDIEEAMNAAAKIGDDALQKQSQGYVVPDSFTHGTSAQRMKWFNAGL